MKLIFLSLPSPEEASRATRATGGHDVAEDVIRRRFIAGMRNFLDVYRHRVDTWMLLDNSGMTPLLIEEGEAR